MTCRSHTCLGIQLKKTAANMYKTMLNEIKAIVVNEAQRFLIAAQSKQNIQSGLIRV